MTYVAVVQFSLDEALIVWPADIHTEVPHNFYWPVLICTPIIWPLLTQYPIDHIDFIPVFLLRRQAAL